MSVYHRMLGSQLPCNVLELLGIQPLPLPAPAHEALIAQKPRGYADVLYRLGLSHLGRQELGLSRECLGAAVDAKPGFCKARLALASICDLLAQHDQAAMQIEAVLEATPLSAQESASADGAPETRRYSLLCAAGFCRERTGEWKLAVDRYIEALKHDPSDLFAEYRLAAIYLAKNKLDEAAEIHRSILEQQPQEQAVRISLAHLLQLLNRHQEAVWEYEKALCMEPESWELRVELAEQLALAGNTTEAIEHLCTLVKRQPHFPDLRLRLANLYADRGDDESAVLEYSRALSIHPDYLECHIALARHELRMGRTGVAAEHFQQAITINDRNVEAYVGLAVSLGRAGDHTRAKETLAQVQKIAGNSDILTVQLGLLELQAQAGEEANDAFRTDQPAPDLTDQQTQRQWLEMQARRYEEILDEHPTWVDVRVRYGMLLKLLGRAGEAVLELQRAGDENPSYAEAWVQLGLAAQQAGDPRAAASAFERAVDIKPEWADLHYRLGLIYCGEMEFDLAMEKLEMAAALNSGNEDFQRQLWVTLEAMGVSNRRPPEDPSRLATTEPATTAPGA